MNDVKTEKRGRFAALVASVESDGSLEVTVLATAWPRPAASDPGMRTVEVTGSRAGEVPQS